MNKKNDKNNNDFANFTALDAAAIFELDAKFLEAIAGGSSSELSGPIAKG